MKIKPPYYLLLASFLSASSVQAQEKQDNTINFDKVESKPVWPGCEDEGTEELRFNCFNNNLMRYIASNVEYPEEARKKGIQGRVFISFIIEKDGSVSNVTVARGTHKLLDNAAVNVIKNIPVELTPGYQDGKPVRMSYTIPINFKLAGKETKKKKKKKNKGIEI